MKSKQQLINRLDSFTHAYITCALWSTMDNADDNGGEALDKNYGITDISIKTLCRMIADCKAFQLDNQELLEKSGQSDEQSGHDFWLTRERHGAGFWYRGLGEIGAKLTEKAHEYGDFYLYVYRGKVHS